MRINAKVLYKGKTYEFVENTPQGLLISNGFHVILVKRHEIKIKDAKD